jgi:hypothetical protein
MTSQGTAHGRFQRAIRRRHLFAAELAARELGNLDLAEALDLTLLMHEQARSRYERGGASMARAIHSGAPANALGARARSRRPCRVRRRRRGEPATAREVMIGGSPQAGIRPAGIYSTRCSHEESASLTYAHPSWWSPSTHAATRQSRRLPLRSEQSNGNASL